MSILGILGGLLTFCGGIALLVFWIMILIKQFKSGQTLWGVLSIFIQILAPIWCFMNGHKGLGMKYVIALVVTFVGYGLLAGSIITQIPEMQMTPAQ